MAARRIGSLHEAAASSGLSSSPELSCLRDRGSFRRFSELKPGDQVRILQGPFAGHLGLYAGMRAHERVLVLLALLGGQQRVELPKADVEAVSNTGRAE
jgi:hypothetical protein